MAVTSGTLWTSLLVKVPPADIGDGIYQGLNSEPNIYRSRKFITVQKGTDVTCGGVGYGNFWTEWSAGMPEGEFRIDDNQVYLFVARYGSVGQTTGELATLWVLSAADFAAMGDRTIAQLEAHHRVRITNAHANYTVAVTDYVQMFARGRGSPIFDELRYGLRLVDVLPIASKPSSPTPLGDAAIH